jgi:hypothetical protein
MKMIENEIKDLKLVRVHRRLSSGVKTFTYNVEFNGIDEILTFDYPVELNPIHFIGHIIKYEIDSSTNEVSSFELI